MTAILLRVLLGERPEPDHEWDAAADQALTRATEREQRMAELQARVDLIQRR